MTWPPRGKEVKKTAQLAEPPLPESVHGLPPNDPDPLLAKLTVPVGVVRSAAGAESVTVARQTVASPGRNTLGEQPTSVAVWCLTMYEITTFGLPVVSVDCEPPEGTRFEPPPPPAPLP